VPGFGDGSARAETTGADVTVPTGLEPVMPLGDLEQLVLFALVRLGDEAHGSAIVRELAERSGRAVAPGALYTVLERLQDKGFVEAWIGDSTPERGGRRRKVYRLLPAGARELRAWYAGLRELASGTSARLDALAEGG
jgi:DNA-binding PadR family transcriptional regulator